jgi:hypothetical protein
MQEKLIVKITILASESTLTAAVNNKRNVAASERTHLPWQTAASINSRFVEGAAASATLKEHLTSEKRDFHGC